MDIRASDRIAEERVALRRVAVLAAGGASPEVVFGAVTAEVRRLLGADIATMARYDPDGSMTYVARWRATGDFREAIPRTPLGGQNLSTLVFETGRPARMDDFSQATGPAAEVVHRLGIRSGVGVPVRVEGRLWGVMFVSSTGEEPLPRDAEARLTDFTELVGAAIAGAQARVELRGHADEQAALRRVATLVAGGAPPAEVFAAVAAEAGSLLGADETAMARYELPDKAMTTVALWSATGETLEAGYRTTLGGQNVSTLVFETGRPARMDDLSRVSGPAGDIVRKLGIRSSAGVPVSVEGRLWGVMTVASTREDHLAADTEARLAAFTELAGTAIANAEAQAALAASRARIVTAADAARRRIERDLHDGAQQRLVTLSLQLREIQAAVPPGAGDLARRLDGVAAGLDDALEELREIARGIHPAVLAQGGLRPALQALADRCSVPVDLHVQVPAARLPSPAEIAAYYVVSEALTNTARHAGATAATVEVTYGEGALRVRVRDDGRGGADLAHGSGLVGLRDRVEALGGRLAVGDEPGAGTSLDVRIPLGGSVRGC